MSKNKQKGNAPTPAKTNAPTPAKTNAPKPTPTAANPVTLNEVDPAPAAPGGETVPGGVTSPSKPGEADKNFATQAERDAQFDDEAMKSAENSRSELAKAHPDDEQTKRDEEAAQEDATKPDADPRADEVVNGPALEKANERAKDDPLNFHQPDDIVVWRWNGVKYPGGSRQIEYMSDDKTPVKGLRLFKADPIGAAVFHKQEDADNIIAEEKAKHRMTARYTATTVAHLRKVVGFSDQD